MSRERTAVSVRQKTGVFSLKSDMDPFDKIHNNLLLPATEPRFLESSATIPMRYLSSRKVEGVFLFNAFFRHFLRAIEE